MSERDEPHREDELSDEELAAQEATELPAREAMSVDPRRRHDPARPRHRGRRPARSGRRRGPRRGRVTAQRAVRAALDRPRRAPGRDDRPLAPPAGLVQHREQQMLDVEPRVPALDRLAHRLLEHLAHRAVTPGVARPSGRPRVRRARARAHRLGVMPHSSSARPDRAAVVEQQRRAAGGRSRPARPRAAPPPPSPARRPGARVRRPRGRSCARCVRRAWRAWAACLVTPSDSATCATTSPRRSPGRRARPRSVSRRRRSSRTAVRPAAGSPRRDAARASCCSLGRRLMRAQVTATLAPSGYVDVTVRRA